MKNISCFEFFILVLIIEKREFNTDFVFIVIISEITLFSFSFSGNFSCSAFILSVKDRFALSSLSSKGPNEFYIFINNIYFCSYLHLYSSLFIN